MWPSGAHAEMKSLENCTDSSWEAKWESSPFTFWCQKQHLNEITDWWCGLLMNHSGASDSQKMNIWVSHFLFHFLCSLSFRLTPARAKSTSVLSRDAERWREGSGEKLETHGREQTGGRGILHLAQGHITGWWPPVYPSICRAPISSSSSSLSFSLWKRPQQYACQKDADVAVPCHRRPAHPSRHPSIPTLLPVLPSPRSSCCRLQIRSSCGSRGDSCSRWLKKAINCPSQQVTQLSQAGIARFNLWLC